MRSRPGRPAAPDPAAPAVVAAHAASKGRYGSRKMKASPGRSGVTVSRRRVCRIMRENGLAGAYGRKRFKVHPGAVNEADVPNVVARGFGGRAPRTHICGDLAYVRVGASWNYVCLLVDLYNREIVGHSAGPGKDVRLVKSAFATLSFPISDIEVFHTDRGSEFDNAEIDLMLEAFGIEHQVDLGQGLPQRQRRRRADQQDTEGRARPPRDVRHDARATCQALGLRTPVRQLQDPLDAGLHVSGRVQGSGAVPPGIAQIGVANPAATFCSYVYLVCLPSMDSSTSLPNNRYTQSHCLTVSRGSDSAFAADSEPCPRSKSPIAAFLASMSCFTLKSTRVKSPPHFSCPRNGGSSDAVEGRFLRIRAVDPIAKILLFLPKIAKNTGRFRAVK